MPDSSPKKRAFLEGASRARAVRLVGPMGGPPPANEALPHLFVDGGLKWGPHPLGWSVGDGDSSDRPLDEKLPPKKDFTDLSYALKLLGPICPSQIELWGFLGGRRDHELAVLGEVHRFLKGGAQDSPRAIFDGGEVWGLGAGGHTLTGTGRFGLMAIEEVKVKIQGNCDYLLENWHTLPPLSGRGVSNRAHGAFEVSCQGPVFVLYNVD